MICALEDVLAIGCEWPEVLTKLLMAAYRDKTSNPRIAQFVKSALEDEPMHVNPLLHAETLIAKCDQSYSSGAPSYAVQAGSAQWDSCKNRREGEDVETLGKRIIEGWLQKAINRKLNARNVYRNPAAAMRSMRSLRSVSFTT